MCINSDIFLGLIAILFPPIAVWVKRGLCSADSLINICLLFLGFFPGLIHAWYIIAKYPEPDYETLPTHEGERTSVTYYYVQQGQGEGARGRKPAPPRSGYGATESAPAPGSSAQAGPSEGGEQQGVPPSYQDAVKGDHKVQAGNQ
ncbi:MAG: hypothetical protein M1814_000205 [Vezdaea aestivalis]|nr:MAG: hypothetical protein M1814_000205 [Vezdaea aestivalis]